MSTIEDRKLALFMFGDSSAGGNTARIYETTALRLMPGWTRDELRQLPYAEVANQHYRSGPPARLYDPCDLYAAKTSEVERKRLVRRARRERLRARRAEENARLWVSFSQVWRSIGEKMDEPCRVARESARRVADESRQRAHLWRETWIRIGKEYAADCLRACDVDVRDGASAKWLRDTYARMEMAS